MNGVAFVAHDEPGAIHSVNTSNPLSATLRSWGRYFTVQVHNADATNAMGPLSKVGICALVA